MFKHYRLLHSIKEEYIGWIIPCRTTTYMAILYRYLYRISILLAVLLVFACKKAEQSPASPIKHTIVEPETTPIVIEGDNIWVRSAPKRGKVMLKLNHGTYCSLIQKGQKDTIRGFIDHWYQIKCKDSMGWVFGSQTNMKSKNSKATFLFLEQSQQFVNALASKDFKVLNSFIHPKAPVHCLLGTSTNDYFRTTITSDLEQTAKHFYDVKDLLDALPKIYDEADTINYLNLIEKRYITQSTIAPGIYYQRLYNGNNYISSYEKWQIKHDMPVTDTPELLLSAHDTYVEREKGVQFRLIIALITPTDDAPLYQFYFYLQEGQWYVSGIHHPLRN